MKYQHLWIEGNSGCGKTSRLVEVIVELNKQATFPQKPLILCFNQETKKTLAEILLRTDAQCYQQKIRTPTGLMIEDVFLFYPLISEQLNLPSSLPVRLLSETEQELATQLWQDDLTPELLSLFGGEYNCVRRILDFIQLAAAGGIPSEKITQRLYYGEIITDETVVDAIGDLILKWRSWCLNKGLLSYGLIYELYWRYLLPNSQYQSYLQNTYIGIFADDVDNFPAIMADLVKVFLTEKKTAIFTYNRQGKVRVGFNADPDYWLEIARFCQVELCLTEPENSLGITHAKSIFNILQYNYLDTDNLQNFEVIKTNSRADLLIETVDFIAEAIANGEVKPQEIAIIVPGLDEVARYSLSSNLRQKQIECRFLREQRPLISSPLIRAILTLLCFLYEGLGKLLSKDMVAEMLVILSTHKIDLVRAGLLADYCYYPDLKSPTLLTVEKFSRWDRLNISSLEAYNYLKDWIEDHKMSIKMGNNNFLVVVDNILASFFANLNSLNYTQVSNLRAFTETVEHFWQVQQKLENHNIHNIVSQLISLLSKGTITANPLPVAESLSFSATSGTEMTFTDNPNYVTIANIYQYRTAHLQHHWHFWLDAGSRFWSQSSSLFASDIFLQAWQPNQSILGREKELDHDLLQRIINDLLARVTGKVFLCHSNLTTNGSEQTGQLLPLLEYLS
jgi:hypothetical protein